MSIHVMSHIGWGGEQITIYKGVETFSVRTISTSGGPGSLQMVSELDIRQCANLLALPRRG